MCGGGGVGRKIMQFGLQRGWDCFAEYSSKTPENVPPEETAEEGEMGGIGACIISSQCRMEAANL